MANRNFQQNAQSLIKERTSIIGAISLSAAGAVLSFKFPGVASVVKTGVGAYLVTLQDAFPHFYYGRAGTAETNQNLDARLGLVDPLLKTVIINTKAAGANADATATCKIYVHLDFANTSVPV